MNNNQLISELEKASKIILAAPNVVTNEERHNAEQIILNFRKSKSPFGICRQILETSQVDYMLFEASEVIKRSLIREWNFLQSSDKEELGQYLLNYVINRDIPSFVRDRILQVICIMVKRASADDSGRQRGIVLTEIENLIINGEHSKKLMACNLILILMQEYATTVKSTDVGLTWEVHFKAKKQFEATDLKRIFQFCLLLLSKISENDPPFDNNVAQLTKGLLQICEAVLTWVFVSPMLPKRLIGMYESVFETDQAPAYRLNPGWEDPMLTPEFLPLMFQIYWKIRYSDELAHHGLTCLVQLASLNGNELFNDDRIRLQYLNWFLENFIKLVSSVTIRSKESVGIANIIKKLSIVFTADIPKIDQQLQLSLIEEMTELTCNFCKGAAEEELKNVEDKYYRDSFDIMLEAGTTLLPEYAGEDPPVPHIKNYAIRIFNQYIQCHLAPPDGCRQSGNNEGEEIEDYEDNDRTRYKSTLQNIGMFGRVVPEHCLPVLYKILENGITKLTMHLQSMQKQTMNLNQAIFLENLFEDLHWTLLISGDVLCMDSDGETPMIPSEIMQHSLKQCQNGHSDLESSLKTLAGISDSVTQPDCIERCDHVIRIFSNVLRLCVIEDEAAKAKLGHFMSPEVSCSLMWFLKRWGLSYLIPVENYYQEVSPILIGAIGKDTEGANFVINYILSKIQSNIYHFSSEPVLLRDTINLFADIVCVKQKSKYIIKTEGLWNLINMQKELKPGTLPPNIRRGLYKGFIHSGTSLADVDEMHKFYDQILQPIQARLKAVISMENFAKNFHREDVQHEIIDILECLIGVAKGGQMSNVNILFMFMSPILDNLPMLLEISNNYQVIVQLILELFGQIAKNMLCYLNHTDSKKLYESTLGVIKSYAKCNTNRLSTESFAEESSLQDLALVLDLLTYILSKDCLDFSPTSTDEEITVTASDVSLFGLSFIMPLMSIDLLKYPSLCNQYYRLLVLINDIFPEKICNLPMELLSQLLQSIEIGLTQFGSDIVQASLDFIQGIATHLFKHPAPESPIFAALKPYLKLLMDLTLSRQINSDLMGAASVSIHALMCIYQSEYEMLVQQLIQSQGDPLSADRLSAAFYNLTVNVELNCGRIPKIKFREKFEKFITNVQGFLLVK